jgi:hypothetical protein
MIIELNVLQDGSCARIFASADPDEESWEGLRAIKIWHNSGKESIERYFIRRQTYDNDFTIRFNSRCSFQAFCHDFSHSAYNQGDKYHFFTHNCANAANHALDLAGIKLDIRTFKLTSLAPHPLTRVPTPFLAPIDLFHKAVAYKINADKQANKNQRFFSAPDFKLSLAKQTLHFWGKQKGEKVAKDTLKVNDAIDKHIKKHPHRLTEYIDLLKDCNDEMFDLKDCFFNSIKKIQFKDRLLSYHVMSSDFLHYLSNFNMILYQLLQRDMLDSVVSLHPVIKLMSAMLFCFAVLCLGHAADNKYGHSRTKETALSRALSELTASLSELETKETVENFTSPLIS